MLRCTMKSSISLQRGLDDLLADLVRARKRDELGRLALLAYCEVRCWARQAGEQSIAECATAMFIEQPRTSKEAFLAQVDGLIADLQRLHGHYPSRMPGADVWHTESYCSQSMLPA